ncbi:sulfite exporter TauE/SafE family protein [Cohnella rhizosphaerae]|uniref:Sulfite exporter TauE/SafE family protein n=1 Tax=Cohnella rhizosphaerae TaxID=1457232 RepID=A0A9X4KUH5_9BACL|nr:sulfite exporter TauE/SafE family protein [Cohnella rhizosphaerae]MDG0811260.1 sulfite exporter TauE/SafE family protein [Cohnella rhizosphaerae]
MNGGDIALAVVAGLTGAPHCIAMCGGIGASIAMEARRSAAASLIAYHAGRIATYGVTGAAMGAAGSFLKAAGELVGLRGAASILGGLLIILWAWRRISLPVYRIKLPGRGRTSRPAAGTANVSKLEAYGAFLSGLSLGLLPCGLTYAMQMKAAATGAWAEGTALLLIFGLTTFPMLFLFAMTARRMSRGWRLRLAGAGRYLAYTMGILSILKGCSANGWIPSIHPWLW